MKTEHFFVSTLDFFQIFFMKNFFSKFELLNSGCEFSASVASLRVRLICESLRYLSVKCCIRYLYSIATSIKQPAPTF